MPKLQVFNSRKRRCTELRALQSNGTSQHQLKRQKLDHPTTGSQPASVYWDNLSKIWLTESALRHLDWRNIRLISSQPRSQSQRSRQPVTRNFLAKLERSRPVAQPASEFLRYCEPETFEDLKRFARNGGPDLSDLKGFPQPVDPLDNAMSLNQSSFRSRKRGRAFTQDNRPTTNTTNTPATGSSGPYSRNFQQKLIDNGVYPEMYKYPDGQVAPEPDNLKEIDEILIRPRPSLSPSRFSNENFKEFREKDAHISKEHKATKMVVPIIEGKIKDYKCVEGEIFFINLIPLINDEQLTVAKPDLYYGGRPEQVNRRVRDKLSGYIIPSTQDDLPIAPNFFLEAKGPDGSLAVAGRQACYDGALGARGMHSLQSYGQHEPVYDNNAYTITSTYHGGVLKMYTSHLTQPTRPRGQPEYFKTYLNGYCMTGDLETFRKGASAYRNARDWAKEQRDEAIKKANERSFNSQIGTLTADSSFGRAFSSTAGASLDETDTIEAQSQESQTSLNKGSNTTIDPPESEASTDELARDYISRAKRSKRH